MIFGTASEKWGGLKRKRHKSTGPVTERRNTTKGVVSCGAD